MNSERVAGFMSEWVAGIIGIRSITSRSALPWLELGDLGHEAAAADTPLDETLCMKLRVGRLYRVA